MRMLLFLIPLFAALPVQAATFQDSFQTVRPEWNCQSGGAGKAFIRDGVLFLDLSAPMTGKRAVADLNLAARLPLTVEWEQCLSKDSPHAYWNGLSLWRNGDERACLIAGLGGGGLQCRWGMAGEIGGAIRPGTWYSLRLEVTSERQTLAVRERDSGKAVGEPITRERSLPEGEYFLGFYQNTDRFIQPNGDEYPQDRGETRIDALQLTAAALRPAVPRKWQKKAPVVFNRKMRWLDQRDGLAGGIIAYDAAGDLWLTGEEAASTWLAEEPLTAANAGAHAAEISLPAGASATKAALRCFQFLLDGHPRLEIEAHPNNAVWSLSATITDPYHAYQRTLTATRPTAEATTQRVDLHKPYRARGYDQRYAELDFLLNIAAQDPAKPASVRFSLRLLPAPCLAARSPVVLGAAQARAEGAPLEAVCVDKAGRLLHGNQVRVTARFGRKVFPLRESGRTGIFRAQARGLARGIHIGTLRAVGAGGLAVEAPVRVRIHDGRYLDHYSPEAHSYCFSDGKAVGPLLGDLYAYNPFFNFNTPRERLVLGMADYFAHCEGGKKPLAVCKQRPLTRKQIATYMEYLSRCGVRAIRLTPNVSVSEEYLDAGGRLSPRGWEQLALMLEEASRRNIHVLINLFHYPYASSGTGSYPPIQRYVDAGYSGPADFTRDSMLPLLHGYLAELLSGLREDNIILGYSLTGENDQSYGAPWINALYRFVKANAPHHLVTQEQGGAIQHVPNRDPCAFAAFEPTRSAGLGYRTYYTERHKSDCYFLVNARLYDRAAPAFLAEVASGPGWYPGAAATWTHPDFITKVRDNFWTALLLRQPMAFSWSACLSEDERLIPTTIARAIDWSHFRRKRPQVAVRVSAPDNEQLARLMQYEAALAALPLDYDYLWDDAPEAGYAVVFDARGAFTAPEWGTTLPEAVREAQPLRLAPGSSATILEGEDGGLAAYVRNTLEYRLAPGYGDGVKELHRQRQKARPVQLEIRARPGHCRYRVWDVDTRQVVRTGVLNGNLSLDLGESAHDFALLVEPRH